MKDSYKVILSLLIGMVKHSQSTQSNKFVISLQYLKKEVRDGVQFLHTGKHQNWHYRFLMKVATHVQSTQNRKLAIFLQYIKKYRNCFCVLLWCRTFRYFMGIQSCYLLLVASNIIYKIIYKIIAYPTHHFWFTFQVVTIYSYSAKKCSKKIFLFSVNSLMMCLLSCE